MFAPEKRKSWGLTARSSWVEASVEASRGRKLFTFNISLWRVSRTPHHQQFGSHGLQQSLSLTLAGFLCKLLPYQTRPTKIRIDCLANMSKRIFSLPYTTTAVNVWSANGLNYEYKSLHSPMSLNDIYSHCCRGRIRFILSLVDVVGPSALYLMSNIYVSVIFRWKINFRTKDCRWSDRRWETSCRFSTVGLFFNFPTRCHS